MVRIISTDILAHYEPTSSSSIEKRRHAVYSLDFQPNSFRLATGGGDCCVKIWNVEQLLAQPDPESSIEKQIEILNDGCLLATLSVNSKCVNIVRWSPDGLLLASGSDDNYILIHRLALNAGAFSGQSFGSNTAKNKENWVRCLTLQGHSMDVLDLSWSPPEMHLLVSCSIDNKLLLWDLTTCYQRPSNNGRGQPLMLPSIIAAKEVLQGHTSFVKGVAFDPLGRYIVSSGADNIVLIWDCFPPEVQWTSSSGTSNHSHNKFRIVKELLGPLRDSPDKTIFRRICWSPDGQSLCLTAAMKSSKPVGMVLKRTSWESVADLVGHAVSSLSTRFCPFMTTYTKYVTKPLPPSDDSSSDSGSESEEEEDEEEVEDMRKKRKTTWDTIRTTESNSNTSTSIKESKASSTSVNPYQYIHSSVSGSNPYRRRTPRIGIQKLRSVNSNSNKQKKTDDVSVVDRVVGDNSEVDIAVPIEESVKGEEEEEVKGESLNEAMDRTGTANSPDHSAAEPSVLVTVETSDSCAQDMEPSTAITTKDGVVSTLIEEPNHGDVVPDHLECDIGSTVAAATTMGEVNTSSDNPQSPRSAPASQDSIAEEEQEEHAKIPAYSQLTESDQTLSSTQRYEDLNGQATSEDHITEANSKEDSLAAHPASSSSSSSSSSNNSSTVRGLYSVHQAVMAVDRGVLYEAKVLQAKYVESSWQYFIHFNGWARRHDTWVEEALIGLSSDTVRLEAIRETMKEEMKRAAAAHADERARARAARKDNDGDSTALNNNATDNSNSNDGEPNGDGDGGDNTGKRGTTSRKKRAVEVQVITHQVPCCLVALGDQAGVISIWGSHRNRPLYVLRDCVKGALTDCSWMQFQGTQNKIVLGFSSMDGHIILMDMENDIGSILDKVSFDKHFEKMYGGKNKQQLIEKSVESLKLHSTTSISTFTSSVNFNAITAAPPSSMDIPSAQNNGPNSTCQQVTRTKDGKKRIRPMLIQQSLVFEGFEENSNNLEQSSSYPLQHQFQQGGSEPLFHPRKSISSASLPERNAINSNNAQKKKRGVIRVARTYLKVDFLHNQDSFLLPLQGGRVEGKVVSTLHYSHILSSVIITESHTTGISTPSSAMVRKSSEISLERAGSSHGDESTTVLWKVGFPSETITCLAGVVLTDASIDSVSSNDKDIPYHGFSIVGSALGYLHILDISNGREIVEKHILGSAVSFVDIVRKDDSCLLLAINMEGEYFVWSIACGSGGSGEVVLECKYRSSLKPLLSHLRMISPSTTSSSGVGSSGDSNSSSTRNTAATIERAFFDTGGDVNVSVSLGKPDLSKRYRYSATSQTWQEIYS